MSVATMRLSGITTGLPDTRASFARRADTEPRPSPRLDSTHRHREIHDPRSSTPATRGETAVDEDRRLGELRRRDREVRAHEQAHKAAAGAHARGGPSYDYVLGPDNRRYAVGGEVSIDTSEVPGDARATLAKMQQVRRAALAPANPSAADRQIAAEASRKEARARRELQASDTEPTTPLEASDGRAGDVRYGENAHELVGRSLDITV